MRKTIELPNDVAAALAGSHDTVLRALDAQLDCSVYLRGNVVTLDGEPAAVAAGEQIVRELGSLIESGHHVAPATIAAVRGAIDADEEPANVLDDVIWRHRSLRVAPKTVNQKRYVDSIRNNTITFGIGPAGTGKTFLAVAMAAAALSRREVNRIILTRPAVEAGERLGFLPGDLMAKIDPYLRPLFDALHDMIDPEKVTQHLERGVIEVAPLAFMRGRSQPLSSQVLTPTSFRPIGSLRVGDFVTGSDGLPTPVIGVYPQGRKPVARLRAQDGASTLCCTEHLWQVFTASDRRRAKPGRVLETQEMVGRLRSFHQHRFELPLPAPVEFAPRDVPIDPYALGLLLGDGCLTAKTTPTFATADPELVSAHGHRGGVIVANPVTVALRELGLAGTRSGTKFVPDAYLHNSLATRLGVLQGLLDSDGGPVMQRGRTCRIQYRTCSERLRDDVVFLVRSLGGIAVNHRSDAFILDIRLPDGISPFRLERKREIYERTGGGRPVRFVDAIEPAGEAETVCIQVAAADSLYITDDFLVTHNTLNDSFVILDEAQNTSPEQMKMFLTRLGFGSKIVVTGDITQVDLPRDQQSGLIVVADILDQIEGVEFVRLGGDDVVRHRLVQRIVEAYDEHGQRSAPELAAKRARPADRKRA